jgi:hypothetical protein
VRVTCPSNISRKRFKDVIVFIGITDGIETDVDGQQQARGSSQVQLHPRSGKNMSSDCGDTVMEC